MASLYELKEQYRALHEKLIDIYGDDNPQVIADTLEGESMELRDKIIACGYVIKDLQALAEAREKAIDEMKESIAALKRRTESLQKYVLDALVETEIDKVDGEHFTVKKQGKAKAVVIDDESRLLPDFWKDYQPAPRKVVDKTKIREALLAGVAVDGAHLDTGLKLVIK